MVPTVEDIVVVVMEDMVVDTGEFSFEKILLFCCITTICLVCCVSRCALIAHDVISLCGRGGNIARGRLDMGFMVVWKRRDLMRSLVLSVQAVLDFHRVLSPTHTHTQLCEVSLSLCKFLIPLHTHHIKDKPCSNCIHSLFC